MQARGRGLCLKLGQRGLNLRLTLKPYVFHKNNSYLLGVSDFRAHSHFRGWRSNFLKCLKKVINVTMSLLITNNFRTHHKYTFSI